MAKQVINIGTTANDGTGDPLRTALDKVNANFTEVYTGNQFTIPNNTVLGNVSGITALPTTLSSAQLSALVGVQLDALPDGSATAVFSDLVGIEHDPTATKVSQKLTLAQIVGAGLKGNASYTMGDGATATVSISFQYQSSGAATPITMKPLQTTTGTGSAFTIRSGDGAATGTATGGTLNLLGGDSFGTTGSGTGGAVVMKGGVGSASTSTANGGVIQLTGGIGGGTTTGSGGSVSLAGGAGSLTAVTANGGNISLTGGVGKGTTSGSGGSVSIFGGGAVTNGFGGAVTISGGQGSTNGGGGQITISGGGGQGTGANGDIKVQGGASAGSGRKSVFILSDTPMCKTNYSKQTPTAGFSIAIAESIMKLLLTPAAAITTGTNNVQFPPNAQDGQEFAISSTQNVSGFTATGFTGHTIGWAPTSLVAGTRYHWFFEAATSTWWPG